MNVVHFRCTFVYVTSSDRVIMYDGTGVNVKKWSQSMLTLGRFVEKCQRLESDELSSGPKLEPDTA